jgi:hypothetical protein
MLANSYTGVENAKPEIIALIKKTAESQFKIGEILLGLREKVESYKNGLNGKSTAQDIKEMKKKWLEKTQPKDETPTSPTEQEVQENQEMLDKMGVGAPYHRPCLTLLILPNRLLRFFAME